MHETRSGSNVLIALNVLVLFMMLSLQGCDTSNPMIKDMEAAYAKAVQKPGDTQAERDDAMTLALHKHFPPGMKAEEAFKRLNDLKEEGFIVGEYRHEGARAWPEGEFKPYLDEGTRRNLQRRYPKGASNFSARKQYRRYWLIITNHVAIGFRVVDGSGVITEVEGRIWASGI